MITLTLSSLMNEPIPRGKPPEMRLGDARFCCVAISGDGTLLAAAGGRLAHVWSLPEGKLVGQLAAPAEVRCLAFSPADNCLVVGGGELLGEAAFLRVWDVERRCVVESFDCVHRVEAVAFSNDGAALFTGDTIGEIARVERASGIRRRICRHGGAALALSASGDGRWLLSSGVDRAVNVWSTESGRRIRTHPGDALTRAACCFLDERRYVTAEAADIVPSDSTVFVTRDVESGRELRRFSTPAPSIRRLVASSDGRRLAVAAGKGASPAASTELPARPHCAFLSVWDAQTGEQCWESDLMEAVSATAFAPDGRSLAAAAYGVSLSELP